MVQSWRAERSSSERRSVIGLGGKGSGRGSGGARTDKVKRDALANPHVLASKGMMPILPEEQNYQNMTLDEIAAHINSFGEKRTIAKITAFMMVVQNISVGRDIKDTNDLRRRFYTYCALSEACGMRVGNMNAYHAMGITMQQAWAWKTGGAGSNPERRKLIEEVDMVCSGSREMLAAMGQINPVLAIFWQKNFDGLKDIQEHSVYAGDPLGEKRSKEEIAEQYADIIDD